MKSQDIQSLLDRVREIKENHRDIEVERLDISINPFAILRKTHDEVNLHSRYIHALLQNKTFLREFIHHVVGIVDFTLDNVKVYRER